MENTLRLQISVSKDMVKRIDSLCEKIGISRSAFCATLIGQGVMGYENGIKVMDILNQETAKTLQEQLTK